MDVLRFLLTLPFKLLRLVGWAIIFCIRLLERILSPIIGQIQWSTPIWVGFIARQLRKVENVVATYPKTVLGSIIFLAAASFGGYYGYHSYLNRPVPIDVAPIVVENVDVRLREPSRIDYSSDNQQPQRITLSFTRSVAPITLIDKVVTEGVTISPAIEGEWRWQNASTLVFTAKKPLPMGKEYKVELNDEKLLAAQFSLKVKKYSFVTTEFFYRLSNSEFYQDPQNPSRKIAIIKISFNAPVDVQSFEKRLEMRYAGNEKLKYTVNYDNKNLTAWVHSEQLSLKDVSSYVDLNIVKGVTSSVAANPTDKEKTYRVAVPSLYSLAVSDIDSELVESENGKDSRVLIVSFSDELNEKELKNEAITAWLLPQHNSEMPDADINRDEDYFYDWALNDVSKTILAESEKLTLEMGDTEQDNQSVFAFKYNAPAHRFLLVKIPDGIESVGGYKLKDEHYQIVSVPDYPKMLNFMSEGALLSMMGEKQITVAARNLPGLQLDIKRVIPSQLQHIVSFKDKNFTSVNFNRLNDEYFTEHFSYQTALNTEDKGQIQYKGIDLSRYLATDPKAKRGIFLLRLSPWDPTKAAKTDNEDDEEYYDEEDNDNVFDARFVVVTDLGIIAKSSIDGSRDVFVQSIYTGEPVSHATVSVIAKNGTTLLSQFTGEDGHVAFANLNDFKNEQTAVLFLVEKEGDISFLPTNAYYDRELNLSRFDIYGDNTPRNPGTLDSFLFSDRGIYRPGETFNIGLITRTYDWKTAIKGVPLRIEVRDPRDTLMLTQPITLNEFGFNELSYTTSENSPTGDWNIYLYLVGKNSEDMELLGSTRVVVKEFEPDLLKVALNLTPDRKQGWVKPSELNASIDVQNLFGTPAQDRRVESKLTLRPVYPNFSRYSDYQFYENRRNNDSFETDLETVTTDENGVADLSLGLDSYADATYQLQLISEAFDAGSGRSVTAAARVMVSPHDYLIGVKSDGSLDYINQKAQRIVNLIAIDPTLKQIAQSELTIALFEQKYISVLTRQNSGVYKYQSKLKEVLINEQPLAIDENGSHFTLDTENPGNFVLVVKNNEGSVLNRINYAVAGNANVTRSLDRNAELQLTLNKESYKAGEEIEISINAPYTGSGIITIERDKVYHWQWFKASTTNSVQKIRVPADLQGNGYINVQFVRDINSDEIFMSPLSYGVMPFKVDRDNFQAQIELQSPEIIKPGDTLPITVKTDSLQQVALFAVDEGILQVARYQLKDPLDHFFRKRSLEVYSTQILDLILPEFSKMMALTSAPGGDAGEGVDLYLNPFKRKKDEPVVYWSGIKTVDGETVFNYKVPEYFNGKLRIMAVSVTPNRIGHAQRYTTVRNDFVLSPHIPTTVAPGDEFDITLGIANNLTDLNGVETKIDATITPQTQLEIVGQNSHQLLLGEKKETVVSFRLKAKEALGNAAITFTVNADGKVTTRTMNLSIRPASAYRTQSSLGRMEGKQQSVTHIRHMFDNYAKRDARVSYSPLVLSSALAQYLANYPYNGSEQITSQAIPLLFHQRNPEMKAIYSQEKIREQLAQTMATLLTRQNGQGAIGTWRSTPTTDPFVTLYVVQFLLEAQEANYPVSDTLLRASNEYLKKLTTNFAYNSQDDLRLRAFAVYLLTRQGEITTSEIAAIQTRMQKNYPKTWQSDIGALYLAASYKMLKMDKQADELLKPTWQEISKAYNNAWWSHNYLDPLIQDSTRLYLIVKHFPEKVTEIPPQLLENMVLSFKEERYTTQSSAMSILALEYYTKQIQSSTTPNAPLTINVKSAEQPPVVISSMTNATAIGNFGSGINEILFNNPTDNPAWYVVTQSGFDSQQPKEALSRGLEITRDYINEKGEVVNSATLGEKLYVHIKVRANAKQGVNNVVLVDLLPGGFEVVQQSMDNVDSDTDVEWLSPRGVKGTQWIPDYSDIREDRVIIYGTASKDVQEFVYQIKATNSGIFSIPPAFAEAMYDREIQALAIGSGVMTVTKPVTKPVAVK
ncbi:alpha-2-macroglobulin family protein [Proteus hauseri]|uniref:alpha-2-macroglobulin family protein n=1 Tax=Proteus hauseri TaxID=183417 RepID=UPI0032DA8314